jgi:copper chaperone CopZ
MKTIEFRQSNMYCNNCFIHAIDALAELKGVYSMDVDMQTRTIRLQMANDAMGKKKIQALVNAALTSQVKPPIASGY